MNGNKQHPQRPQTSLRVETGNLPMFFSQDERSLLKEIQYEYALSIEKNKSNVLKIKGGVLILLLLVFHFEFVNSAWVLLKFVEMIVIVVISLTLVVESFIDHDFFNRQNKKRFNKVMNAFFHAYRDDIHALHTRLQDLTESSLEMPEAKCRQIWTIDINDKALEQEIIWHIEQRRRLAILVDQMRKSDG